MKKFALAAVTAAALAFAAPAVAFEGAAAPRMQLAQADVKVKIRTGDRGYVRKKVVVRHGDRGYGRKKVVVRYGDRGHVRKKVVIRQGDRDRRRGWSHSRRGEMKTIVVKKRGNGTTVIRKKTIYR